MVSNRADDGEPAGVRVERDVRIPARDGVELSANLWLPAGADDAGPWPAILEMIPWIMRTEGNGDDTAE